MASSIKTTCAMMRFNELLFAPLGTKAPQGAHGMYQANAKGVHLYKLNGELEAYIVNNASQGRFVVTAFTADGAPRYMFSTASYTERWLRMEGMSLMREDEVIAGIKYGAEALSLELELV